MFLNSDQIFRIPEIIASCEDDRSIFVFFERTDEDPETMALLHNILKAADAAYQVKTKKIALEPNQNLLAYPLTQTKHPKRILVFGADLERLGFHLTPSKYTPVQIGAANLLWGDNLSAINTDKSLKIALWKAIQNMFKPT
ncbi:MAG: hypothetical protein ACK4NS_12265 [Saprospiraceae bacterium]